ncbi:MAG TPA: hypothetical protein VMN60_09160 [Longimicrobiales bacterium]|nr:hypothetical protein [Longimicrobiales bacterium]
MHISAGVVHRKPVRRWGQGTYHISAQGRTVDGEAFRQDAGRRLDSGQEPSGRIALKPRLRSDYFGGAPAAVRRFLADGRPAGDTDTKP